MQLPTYADVAAAAERLRGHAIRTPLLYDTPLDALTGGRILLKAETLQRTGSFKFRGAYNRLVQLDAAQRRIGVVAFSSGNHAQGVAAAARELGLPATIVMPADAPRVKAANTRAYGAEVVEYDRRRESREEIAARIAAARGAVVVPAFDDAQVIAGQGTAGLEIAEQAVALGLAIDVALICCSGGGLVAGCALALKQHFPGCRIYTAEPTTHDDYRRSLAAGERLANDPAASSICDALMVPTPGELTFAINRTLLAGGVVASDDEVRAAMAYGARTLKLVLEPGGAIALAALLAGRIDARGRTVAVMLSGGNIDDEMLASVLR